MQVDQYLFFSLRVLSGFSETFGYFRIIAMAVIKLRGYPQDDIITNMHNS